MEAVLFVIVHVGPNLGTMSFGESINIAAPLVALFSSSVILMNENVSMSGCKSSIIVMSFQSVEPNFLFLSEE